MEKITPNLIEIEFHLQFKKISIAQLHVWLSILTQYVDQFLFL